MAGLLAVLLCLLAIARPVDHDESQYVAAATLSGAGLIPYRDYAYLQTPLQPLLFAPIVVTGTSGDSAVATTPAVAAAAASEASISAIFSFCTPNDTNGYQRQATIRIGSCTNFTAI